MWLLAIELDPRSMTPAWTRAIAVARIERASLGVQTFAARCQEAIGRVQPEDLIVGSVDSLEGYHLGCKSSSDIWVRLPPPKCRL